MPKQKDLKRLVRGRMEKTGESYTVARAQLVAKLPTLPADPAALAGMSDDAVAAKTGKTWRQWVRVLDRAQAASMPHREIAQHVHDNFEVSGWWAQMVTVGYERLRGLRDPGQRRGGSYDVNKSKTVGVPIETLYRAFSEKRRRLRWLDNDALEIRTSTRNKSMRMSWGDGTQVNAYFTAKGDSKSQVAVQHSKLASKSAADETRAQWGERLGALAELLKPAR